MHSAEYGKLVQWDKYQAHRWDIVRFPRAQLVIEAQSMLLKFIRGVIEGVLENVLRESMSNKWIELVEHVFRKSKEFETWTLLINQAFTAPSVLSVDRVGEIATTRFANAQDHIWLLRTDPHYLQNEARYFLDSQQANSVREHLGRST
jgi:hypothetical protein